MRSSLLRLRSPLLMWSHAVVCGVALIFVCWALLTPDPYAAIRNTSLSWLQYVADTILHTAVFWGLTGLLFSFAMQIWEHPPVAVIWGLLTLAVMLEGLQIFVPGRTCDPRDGIANLAGFVLGISTVRVLAALSRAWNLQQPVACSAE